MSNVVFCAVLSVTLTVLQFDTATRNFAGELRDRLLVGMDPVLLHGHMDMDLVLRGRHEVTIGRQKRTSCVLSFLGLGASRNSHYVRADHSVHSGCKVRF